MKIMIFIVMMVMMIMLMVILMMLIMMMTNDDYQLLGSGAEGANSFGCYCLIENDKRWIVVYSDIVFVFAVSGYSLC